MLSATAYAFQFSGFQQLLGKIANQNLLDWFGVGSCSCANLTQGSICVCEFVEQLLYYMALFSLVVLRFAVRWRVVWEQVRLTSCYVHVVRYRNQSDSMSVCVSMQDHPNAELMLFTSEEFMHKQLTTRTMEARVRYFLSNLFSVGGHLIFASALILCAVIRRNIYSIFEVMLSFTVILFPRLVKQSTHLPLERASERLQLGE